MVRAFSWSFGRILWDKPIRIMGFSNLNSVFNIDIFVAHLHGDNVDKIPALGDIKGIYIRIQLVSDSIPVIIVGHYSWMGLSGMWLDYEKKTWTFIMVCRGVWTNLFQLGVLGGAASPRRQTHFGNTLSKSGLKQVSGSPSICQRAGAQNSKFLFEVT